MYGYEESEKLGPGVSGGTFGKNTGFLTKFEYNANGGKDGVEQDSVDITVQIEEKEYKTRVFPVVKVFKKVGQQNVELTDTTTQEYKDLKELAQKETSAYLVDFVKALVPEETIKESLTNIPNFKTFVQVLQRLVQSVPNWQKQPIDIWLEYQWKPSGTNTRTFLQLPTKVKHGKVVCKSLGEGWIEEKTETHLVYLKDGEIHPLKRGKWYLESVFSKQQNFKEVTSTMETGGGDWDVN